MLLLLIQLVTVTFTNTVGNCDYYQYIWYLLLVLIQLVTVTVSSTLDINVTISNTLGNCF